RADFDQKPAQSFVKGFDIAPGNQSIANMASPSPGQNIFAGALISPAKNSPGSVATFANRRRIWGNAHEKCCSGVPMVGFSLARAFAVGTGSVVRRSLRNEEMLYDLFFFS